MKELTYSFRRMTEADLPLLETWLQTPEWRLWWGDPDEELATLAADLHEPGMRLWIVSHGAESNGGGPFAFLQDYDVHAWPDHPYRELPRGTRGIDQSIGRAEMIGCGHGSAFIARHVMRLFDEGAPCVVTDPDPENRRAIRAYEKAGFTFYRDAPLHTPWGVVQLMLARREDGA